MENVPGKSFEDRGFGRLLYRADDSISSLIRVSGTGARSPPNAAYRRDGSSDGGMDRAATAGSISMGQRAAFLTARPRPHFRCRFHEASRRTGDGGSAGSDRRAATAGVHRARDRHDSSRMSGPSDRFQRSDPVPAA